ncbi:MAG: hypothetical protein ACKVXR_01130 [Planctomycetota bacterium]
MSKRTFWLLFLLLFLTRAALVLSIADVFSYGDEMPKGGAAKALIDGIGVPSWKLTYVQHEGGGFLVMHLKALVFLVFGPSVLAQKITAFLTTALLLWVGLRFAWEHFGAKAAGIFGLLFVFCPESYLRSSMLALGTHFESAIPIALVFHYALRVLFQERARLADWFLLGIFAGLGAYFSLQTAPALAIVAVAVLLRLRARILGAFAGAAILGFGLGALPLWLMMGHVGLGALLVQGREGFASGPKGLDALREIGFHLLEGDPAALVQTLGFGIVIVAGLVLARGAEGGALRRRSLPILAYLGVFILILVQSGFLFPNRGHWFFWLRCSPFWFFSALLFAAWAAHWIDNAAAARRQIALGAVAIVLVFGVTAFGALVLQGRTGSLLGNGEFLARAKGYDLQGYFDRLVHRLEGPIPDRFAVLERIRDEPDLVLPSAAHSLFEKSGVTLAEAVAITRASSGEHWRTALKGLGLVAAPDYGHDIRAAFDRIETRPLEEREPLAEALGRVALGIKILPEKIDIQCRLEVPDALREPFLRGAGWRVHALYPLRDDLALELIGRQPEDAGPSILAGYRDAQRTSTLK